MSLFFSCLFLSRSSWSPSPSFWSPGSLGSSFACPESEVFLDPLLFSSDLSLFLFFSPEPSIGWSWASVISKSLIFFDNLVSKKPACESKLLRIQNFSSTMTQQMTKLFKIIERILILAGILNRGLDFFKTNIDHPNCPKKLTHSYRPTDQKINFEFNWFNFLCLNYKMYPMLK
ncbi:hypothetical protein BpHYR1_043793 [Brachionus plicatilis]|uniref:Uncharacterized protein n=1 Tax=Brachionus plicatilis TaxID=10195 RepID=A0A3M7QP00_BRAPC|nr:hypothetical protein BpHYR1_043793 [Brachionus plicatilis]